MRGIVLAVSGGRSAQDLAPAIRWFGIQRLGIDVPGFLHRAAHGVARSPLLCRLLLHYDMAKTPFGWHLIMIGGNEVATFRAGIKVNKLLIIAFVLAGAIAGLAGWLLAIRTSGATANLGIGLFNAFAAVVIGGVSLQGGVGNTGRLCRCAAALGDQHRHQFDGPAGDVDAGLHGLLVLAAVLLDTFKQTSSELA